MASNYPPGVSEGTYGAPWNDEQFCVDLTIKMTVPFTLNGPLGESRGEAMKMGMEDVIEQIREVLHATDVENVEIIHKTVSKC